MLFKSCLNLRYEKYQSSLTRPTLAANHGERISDMWVHRVPNQVSFVLTVPTVNIPGMFRLLGLWDDVGSTITPSQPQPQPPLPMMTYDQGLLSLPDDIICEILGLLDKEALKSCSLTGKAISCSAKPILHRTLYLTPGRPGVRKKSNAPGQQSEFKGLPILGERGLLQYTRHISISLPCNPLFPQDLRPHIQYLHTITNLRSLRTRWLDIPSFLLQMGEYFGTFLESLQSLELEFPRGDHNQILYFVSQFPNLRDLRIEGVQDYTHAMRNGGPHFDITASPPLNGTLDLQLNTWNDRGAQLVFYHLLTLPSGLKFRTLKLSGCTDHKPQLLVDACASTLECMDFTGQWYSKSFLQTTTFFVYIT